MGEHFKKGMINFSSEGGTYSVHTWDYGVISITKYSDHLMELINRLEKLDLMALVPSF